MLAAAKTSGLGMFVPKGLYRFDSRPNEIDFVANLQGLGGSITGSTLLKNYAETVLTRGMLEFLPPSDGSKVAGFFSKVLAGGGTVIAAKASASATMTNLVLEDLNLSFDVVNDVPILPDHHIHFDGTAKYISPKGDRVNCFRNVKVFGATHAPVILRGCNGLWWHGGGIYPAEAAAVGVNSGSLVISGTSACPSSGITVDIQTCSGIVLTQATDLRITVNQLGAAGDGYAIRNDATVLRTRTFGRESGLIETDWQQSGHFP